MKRTLALLIILVAVLTQRGAFAHSGPACDCNVAFGSTINGNYCANAFCETDQSWPMCGWFWNTICDGRNAAGSGPKS
jgi:hypothetical protein